MWKLLIYRHMDLPQDVIINVLWLLLLKVTEARFKSKIRIRTRGTRITMTQFWCHIASSTRN
jgi:hypothetical protein